MTKLARNEGTRHRRQETASETLDSLLAPCHKALYSILGCTKHTAKANKNNVRMERRPEGITPY